MYVKIFDRVGPPPISLLLMLPLLPALLFAVVVLLVLLSLTASLLSTHLPDRSEKWR